LELCKTLGQTNFYLNQGEAYRVASDTPMSVLSITQLLNDLPESNLNLEYDSIKTLMMKENLFKIFEKLRLMIRTLFFKSVYLDKIPNPVLNRIATQKNQEFEAYWLGNLLPLCDQLDTLIIGCLKDLNFINFNFTDSTLMKLVNNYAAIRAKLRENILNESNKINNKKSNRDKDPAQEDFIAQDLSKVFSDFEKLIISVCLVINDLNKEYAKNS
jgi:hypothetical protein